jgi:hypothetical protein
MSYLPDIDMGRISALEITCVDPAYAASSLPWMSNVDVSYTPGNHPLGGHVQQAPGLQQFFFRYNRQKGLMEPISQSDVHDNLPNGIMQLAYDADKEQAVLGIPGDVYAFSMNGAGFAFGKPKVAPAWVANAVLGELMNRHGNPNGVDLYVMMHPDCGLFANNVGVISLRKEGVALDPSGKDFMGSAYQTAEHAAKQDAKGCLYGHGSMLMTHSPEYVQRTPGIVSALKKSN